ncbi:hypothetical protein D3C75_611730 [compost metagenome]
MHIFYAIYSFLRQIVEGNLCGSDPVLAIPIRRQLDDCLQTGIPILRLRGGRHPRIKLNARHICQVDTVYNCLSILKLKLQLLPCIRRVQSACIHLQRTAAVELPRLDGVNGRLVAAVALYTINAIVESIGSQQNFADLYKNRVRLL